MVVTAQNYKDGNNYLNKQIIERLQYDKDRGIAGNNRFTQDFSGKYDDFLSSRYAGWGYPSNLMPETTSNAGYKVFSEVINQYKSSLNSVIICSLSTFYKIILILVKINLIKLLYPIFNIMLRQKT